MQLVSLIFLSVITGQRFTRRGTLFSSGVHTSLENNTSPISPPSLGTFRSFNKYPKISNDALNPMNVGRKVIATLLPTGIPLMMDSLRNVPAVPKHPPGKIAAASIEHVKKNFINAHIPLCPNEKIGGKHCICKQTYPHVEYIEDEYTRTSAVVAINAKYNQIVVSYKLTDNLQNWFDNLSMQPVDVVEMPKGVRVHRGIYSNLMGTYNQAQDSVIALLDNPNYKNHSLFITGFSLGGGMAQLSIPSWYKLLKALKDSRPIEVISYSNPRVGNRAFANYLEAFNIPITRYTNQNDLVSHLPGRKPGFVHAGAEVYGTKAYGSYSIRECSQAYDEDPTCVLGSFNTKSPLPHAYPFGKFIPLPPYC